MIMKQNLIWSWCSIDGVQSVHWIKISKTPKRLAEKVAKSHRYWRCQAFVKEGRRDNRNSWRGEG